MVLVGGCPVEKGDERMRTRDRGGKGGEDEEEDEDEEEEEEEEASLDALVAKATGWRHIDPDLMLKQRCDAVLKARTLPPTVTNDSIAQRVPEVGAERKLV